MSLAKNHVKGQFFCLNGDTLINEENLKLLANGNINTKIDIEADFSSVTARSKIESLGGILKVKNQK